MILLDFQRILNLSYRFRRIFGFADYITADIYKASFSLTGGYQPSRTYRYSFTIGPDQYILFSLPTIQDWEDAEGGNYLPQ